jgi:GMP synthase (glutamine-hydrolysing)
MLNILCITHADFETPGVIKSWAKDRNYKFQIVNPYNNETIPSIDGFDFLIIMGGPQSPIKLNEYPYLADEINITKDAISKNKKVLGFCLGAQIIGEALGATTSRSPEKEVGVYPITLTKEGQNDPLLEGLPLSFPVIHWHNDMPGLTEDSAVLAASAGCPRQIVRYAPNVYGFQCHLEITLEGIKTMIEAVPEDLKPSKFTQTKEELLSQDYEAINNMMIELLDRLTQSVEQGENSKYA